jgi:transmembrane sensor
MLQNKDRITELLTQYINKTISEKDFAELFDYINKEENKDVLYDFMKKYDKTDWPDADVHHVDWDFMYNNIVNNKNSTSKASNIIQFSKKLTIAAAIILVCYIGIKQFFLKSEIHKSVVTYTKKDIPPGSDKAILKLADGSEIILPDQENGLISEQGQTHIKKNSEGFIEYIANNNIEKVVYNTLSTPRAGQYKLMLPDKSLVWLNSESSITFPTAFVGKQRKVIITGEVYFEIAKDKQKPFFVENENTNVEVLGTHFNINTYANEDKTTITLLEGSIKLSNKQSSEILHPGQQAWFNKDENINIKSIDTDNAVDWKNGLFIFENASLVSVMKEIERWYNVDVEYIGTKPDIKFNGIIQRNNNISKLLKILEAAGNIDFVIKENKIEVKQKKQT